MRVVRKRRRLCRRKASARVTCAAPSEVVAKRTAVHVAAEKHAAKGGARRVRVASYRRRRRHDISAATLARRRRALLRRSITALSAQHAGGAVAAARAASHLQRSLAVAVAVAVASAKLVFAARVVAAGLGALHERTRRVRAGVSGLRAARIVSLSCRREALRQAAGAARGGAPRAWACAQGTSSACPSETRAQRRAVSCARQVSRRPWQQGGR